MLSREWLYQRRCVRDLIQIVDGVALRAASRPSLPLDDSTVGLLLFWTILRGERTFLLRCLEQLGVDMWALTCDVDELLHQRRIDPRATADLSDLGYSRLQPDLDRPLWAWLDRADQEAVALGHPYLGTEHLLLAIVANAEESVSAILSRHGLSRERLAAAVQAALAAGLAASERATPEIAAPDGTRAADSEESGVPAVGVPRRFSLASLMMTMVTYAMLLAVLPVGGASTEIIVLLMVLFTAAGIGQPILFGGKSPRAAATCVGTVLFPVEVLALILYYNISGAGYISVDEGAVYVISSPALGALLGYAAGCLAAGVFFLNDRYEKFKRRHAGPEQPDADPLASGD